MLLKAYTLKSIFHDPQYAKMRDRPQPSDTFSDRPTSATAIILLGQQHCDHADDKDTVANRKGRCWLIAIAKLSFEPGDLPNCVNAITSQSLSWSQRCDLPQR
jgi:hypothetical protein